MGGGAQSRICGCWAGFLEVPALGGLFEGHEGEAGGRDGGGGRLRVCDVSQLGDTRG